MSVQQSWGWQHARLIRELRDEVDTLEAELWPSLDARLTKVEQELQTLRVHFQWVVSVLGTIGTGEP